MADAADWRPPGELPTALPALSSDLIRIARVLCILFMMTTHIWPGSTRILAADVGAGTHVAFVVIVDSLGRAAVPLLSTISGILFAYSFARRTRARIVESKFKTLIVPMAVWSVPIIILNFGEVYLTGASDELPVTPLDWLNSVLALTAGPANGPLHFLREIFIMALYGIAILSVWRFSRLTGLMLGIAIALLEQIPGGFLLFRNQIATFYIFGLMLACFGQAHWKPGWPLVVGLVAALVLSRVMEWHEPTPENHVAMRMAQHFPRFAMTMLMWRVAYELALRPNPIKRFCMAVEPHIFTIFCSHAIVVKVVSAVAYFAHWRESASYYPLIFAGQLVVCVAVGCILSYLLKPFPWLRGKASGKKVMPPEACRA